VLAGCRRKWLESGHSSWNLTAEIWADRILEKVAGIRQQWPNVVEFQHRPDSSGGQLFEREGRLCRLKDGRMHLPYEKIDLRF
jgi:hypothetical protein